MLVLHIGYAKSATTFLQKQVFPNLGGVNYIGRYYGKEDSSTMKADWVYDFVFRDNISTKSFADIINSSVTNKSQPHIISHEVFLRPYKKYRLLHRLKDLEDHDGKIKVIVSIRNQMDVILSRCVHDRTMASYSIVDALDFEGATECQWPYCSRGKKSLWKNEECACKRAGIKFINVPFYNYLDLMCQLSSLFGEGNVHFIVSENLRNNPADEIDSLTNFLGVESMECQLLRSLGEKTENVQRDQSLYEEVRSDYVSSGKRQEVFENFKFSNKLLSESKQLDLGTHGYY
jgi:hypothetical protein